MLSSGYIGVRRLVIEKPKWLPIVEVTLEIAKTTKGDFCGAWVLNEAKRKGITNWFPGLKVLKAYGILQKTDTARGGRRAYYIMPDIEGVEKALQELKDK